MSTDAAIVASVGNLFVDRVKDTPPDGPADLKAEFSEFCASLDSGMRKPLADFVSNTLVANPDTAWMAAVITGTAKDSSEVHAAAHAAMMEIKANNARIHGDAKKGSYISFAANGKHLDLLEAMDALESGTTVTMTTTRYEKLGFWHSLICDTIPVLAGEMCKWWKDVAETEVRGLAELPHAWKDAQLVS